MMTNVDSLKEILYELSENGDHIYAVRGRGSSIEDINQIDSSIKAEIANSSFGDGHQYSF